MLPEELLLLEVVLLLPRLSEVLGLLLLGLSVLEELLPLLGLVLGVLPPELPVLSLLVVAPGRGGLPDELLLLLAELGVVLV